MPANAAAAEKFKGIAEAYACLSDEMKRRPMMSELKNPKIRRVWAAELLLVQAGPEARKGAHPQADRRARR